MSARRQEILEALLARLHDIAPANGYATEAGLRISYGRTQLSPDDTLPAATLVPGDPTLQGQGEGDRYRLSMPVTASGLVTVDPADPLASIEPLLADLKKALLRKNDVTLGGLAIRVRYVGEHVADREEGGTTAAVQVSIAVEYMEGYGDP